MAHELDFTTGRAAIALRGGGASAWHGYGEAIEDTDTLDDIARKAGLGWSAHKAPVIYRTADGMERGFRGVSVIYRDDTGDALGTASDARYTIHQPREILDFFREFLRAEGLSIETAGALRGGRVVWVLANLGPDFRHLGPGGDDTQGYVRLQTSFDTSRCSSLVGTAIRQVCANTEAMIESATRASQYRQSHASGALDSRGLAAAFGLLGDQWRVTCDAWNAMQARRVTDEEARLFFCRVAGIDPADVGRKDANGEPVISTKALNGLQALADAYRTGPGAQMPGARATAYGLLNAVTYYADHAATVRDTYGDGKAAARLASAWEGTGAAMKERAREFAAELAGVALAA